MLDMFGDHTLGGWGKASRALVPSFRPWLGAFTYPIARSRSMNEPQIARATEARVAQERYIQQVAGPTGRPRRADAKPKKPLDSGAVSQAEYDTITAGLGTGPRRQLQTHVSGTSTEEFTR
jgi:hypothetical protein